MRKIIVAIVTVFALLASTPPAAAAPIDVIYLGRECKANGDTRAGVQLINNTNNDKRPSWWYNYTDTGFGMGWKDLFANSKTKVWVPIPAGREIDYFAVYPSQTATTPIWSRSGIKALDCPVLK